VVASSPAASIVETEALPGAGALPGRTIPSIGVAVDGDHLEALRSLDPPIVARVQDGRTVLDLRSVEPGDDPLLARALGRVAEAG
jgi:L-seryl-tRNA(Ser) seleniumtransferase